MALGDNIEEVEIIKPRNDKREYRSILLQNNLQVLLISDAETDKVCKKKIHLFRLFWRFWLIRSRLFSNLFEFCFFELDLLSYCSVPLLWMFVLALSVTLRDSKASRIFLVRKFSVKIFWLWWLWATWGYNVLGYFLECHLISILLLVINFGEILVACKVMQQRFNFSQDLNCSLDSSKFGKSWVFGRLCG